MMAITIRFFFVSILILVAILPLNSFSDDTSFWKPQNAGSLIKVDHSQWQLILDKYIVKDNHTNINRVNYAAVSEDDKKGLANYISSLERVNPRDLSPIEQKAYWINLYNALTVNLIIANYPTSSIKKLGSGLISFGPWDDEITIVLGKKLTLNTIEHEILRPIFKDNRIHFAVNCASLGCPNLSKLAFTSDNIENQLNLASVEFINHPRGVKFSKNQLVVSSIFHWYKEDFGGNNNELIKFLAGYAKGDLKKRLENYRGDIEHDYDWSLNKPD